MAQRLMRESSNPAARKRFAVWRGIGVAVLMVGAVVMALFAGRGVARASALAITVSSSFPISIDVFIPCANGGAGEDVVISGQLHDLFSVTISDSGDFHLDASDNPQAVSGVGQITGAQYQGTGITRSDFTQSGAVFPITDNFVNNFRIIGQGPGNNFAVHDNLHVTVNADGTLTSFHDNFSFTCS